MNRHQCINLVSKKMLNERNFFSRIVYFSEPQIVQDRYYI